MVRTALFLLLLGVIFACGPARRQRPEPSTGPAFSVEVTGKGPPVILIPGLASTGEVWATTVERLSSTHTCHVLTLTGFDGGAPLAPPFLEKVRDELIAYMDEQQMERPVLIGHSMGGTLAMWTAVTAPDRVGRVLAVDGLPFLPDLYQAGISQSQAAAFGQSMGDRIASMTRAQYVAQARGSATSYTASEHGQARIIAWAEQVNLHSVGDAIAELYALDLRDDLTRHAAPLLLVGAGTGDATQDAATAARYADQLRHAPSKRVLQLADARHFIMYDAPERLAEIIETYLSCPALESCPL